MMLEGADYTEGFVRCVSEVYKPDWVDDFVVPGGQLIAKRKVRHTLPNWGITILYGEDDTPLMAMRCAVDPGRVPFAPLIETQVSSFGITRGCLKFFSPGGGCHVESVSEGALVTCDVGASLHLSIVDVTYTRTRKMTELLDSYSETPWFTVVEPVQ